MDLLFSNEEEMVTDVEELLVKSHMQLLVLCSVVIRLTAMIK